MVAGYVRGKGVLVGVFTFAEMANGDAAQAIVRAKEQHDPDNVYHEAWCESCVPVGWKIWLAADCDKR